jgi:hypothetical protein
MGKSASTRLALILALVILLLFNCNFSREAKADTLGPLVDRSEELNVTSVIEINSPQNTTYSTSEILLNFTLIYEGSDYAVGYNIDGGTIERISVSKISEEPAPYLIMPPYVRVTCMGTVVIRDLSDGNHTVTVYGGYYYGGINQRYEVFKRASVSFTVGKLITAPPSISLFSIENKTYDKADISLTFTISDSATQIMYSLDGEENVSISGNTTLTGLANGDHNLTLFAKDEAGNTGASRTIWFSVAEPFPTTLVVLASVAAVAVVGGSLLVYFKKRKH